MNATSNTPEREERILVCLSSSPSNHKVIAAAAKMAVAFRAALTAIYVKPSGYDAMSDADKARLQSNMRLAEQSGAVFLKACLVILPDPLSSLGLRHQR